MLVARALEAEALPDAHMDVFVWNCIWAGIAAQPGQVTSVDLDHHVKRLWPTRAVAAIRRA